MLLKVPSIRRLYEDSSNEKHKRVIDEGIKVQTPLIERLLGQHPPGFFMYCEADRFVLPVDPTIAFMAFAFSVAESWDSTTRVQRAGFGLPELFLQSGCSTEFCLFSYNQKNNPSLRHLINRTRSVQRRIMTLEHLKRLRDRTADMTAIREELWKDGVKTDSISFEGDSLSYETGRGMKSTVSDIDAELRISYPQMHGILGTMARRFCFGFSPLL